MQRQAYGYARADGPDALKTLSRFKKRIADYATSKKFLMRQIAVENCPSQDVLVPKLARILDALRSGDILIVCNYDSLTTAMKELVAIRAAVDARDAKLIVLDGEQIHAQALRETLLFMHSLQLTPPGAPVASQQLLH